MSEDFNKTKEKFLKLYPTKRRYITSDEVAKMDKLEKKKINFDESKGMGYILEPLELEDEELKVHLLMMQYELQVQQNKKLSTIKNIMLFWLFISIVGILGFFK